MKTTSFIHRVLPVIVCLLFAIASISCQTNTPPTVAVQQPVTCKNWVKVSSQPPTYYPRGTSSDCPTDFRSGEWVQTGDEKGTRYFIPLHGLTHERRSNLLYEALAARSPNMKNQIAREDASLAAKNCAAMLFYLSPPGWFVAMGQMPDNNEQGHSASGWPSAGNVNINPSIGSINCPSSTVGCPVGGVAGR